MSPWSALQERLTASCSRPVSSKSVNRSPAPSRNTLRRCASSSPTIVPRWSWILSLGKKNRAIKLLPSAEQKRHPLLFLFASHNFKICGKLIDHLSGLWIQNAGEDQETLGSNLALQRSSRLYNRLRRQIRHHHRK